MFTSAWRKFYVGQNCVCFYPDCFQGWNQIWFFSGSGFFYWSRIRINCTRSFNSGIFIPFFLFSLGNPQKKSDFFLSFKKSSFFLVARAFTPTPLSGRVVFPYSDGYSLCNKILDSNNPTNQLIICHSNFFRTNAAGDMHHKSFKVYTDLQVLRVRVDINKNHQRVRVFRQKWFRIRTLEKTGSGKIFFFQPDVIFRDYALYKIAS